MTNNKQGNKLPFLRYLIYLSFCLPLFFPSCKCGTNISKKYLLSYGEWRGSFSSDGGEIPFLFELKLKDNDSISFTVLNNGEKITSNRIDIIGDSIIIEMPVYESVIIAKISGPNFDTLVGSWIKTKYDVETKIPFKAVAGGKYTFLSKKNGFGSNVQGKWMAKFISDSDSEEAIGTFTQESLEVRGTFLTSTGDYRYLGGILDVDTLLLSCFDGSSSYLFKLHVKDSKEMSGHIYYAGKGSSQIVATKSDLPVIKEVLPKLIKGKSPLDLTFETFGEKKIDMKTFAANKVTIIQILGTWCHNCIDETKYLQELNQKYASKGLNIIGLSFERTNIKEKAFDNIRKLKEEYNVTYPLCVAGTTKKESIAEALPFVESIPAFPTGFILNKKGEIVKMHSGFPGPSTKEYYQAYCKEMDILIQSLLAE